MYAMSLETEDRVCLQQRWRWRKTSTCIGQECIATRLLRNQWRLQLSAPAIIQSASSG